MEEIIQIYDKIFKRIITLSSPAVIRFINTVFNKDFDLGSKIVYNWTESVDNNLNKIIADTIITINDVFKFHIEVQISDDNNIALRMFEYEFKDAIKYKRITDTEITLDLPEAKIIYLEHTKNTPDAVKLIFKFQGQGVFQYEVKTEKLLKHSIDDLDNSGMIILMPLYILKLRKKIKSSYSNHSKELAQELKALLKSCIISIEKNEQQGNITYDDMIVLLNLLETLYRQLYDNYNIFKYEGVDSMLSERLVTYTERVLEEKVDSLVAEKLEGYTEHVVKEKVKEVTDIIKFIKNGKSIEEIEKLSSLPKEEIISLRNLINQ